MRDVLFGRHRHGQLGRHYREIARHLDEQDRVVSLACQSRRARRLIATMVEIRKGGLRKGQNL
jgi:hypothetical protein